MSKYFPDFIYIYAYIYMYIYIYIYVYIYIYRIYICTLIFDMSLFVKFVENSLKNN